MSNTISYQPIDYSALAQGAMQNLQSINEARQQGYLQQLQEQEEMTGVDDEYNTADIFMPLKRNADAISRAQTPYAPTVDETRRKLLQTRSENNRERITGDNQSRLSNLEYQMRLQGRSEEEIQAKLNEIKNAQSKDDYERMQAYENNPEADPEFTEAINELSLSEVESRYVDRPLLVEYIKNKKNQLLEANLKATSIALDGSAETWLNLTGIASTMASGLAETTMAVEGLSAMGIDDPVERLKAFQRLNQKDSITGSLNDWANKNMTGAQRASVKRAEGQQQGRDWLYEATRLKALSKGKSAEEAEREANSAVTSRAIDDYLNNDMQVTREGMENLADVGLGITTGGATALAKKGLVETGKAIVKAETKSLINKVGKQNISHQAKQQAKKAIIESGKKQEAQIAKALSNSWITKGAVMTQQGITTGLQNAPEGYQNASQAIMAMNPTVVASSPEGQKLRESDPNLTDLEIQQLLADKAGSKAYKNVAWQTGLVGVLGGLPEAKLASRMFDKNFKGGLKQYLASVGINAVTEGIEEDRVKHEANKAINNTLGDKYIDENKGRGESAILGALSGGTTTAVTNALLLGKKGITEGAQTGLSAIKDKQQTKINQDSANEINNFYTGSVNTKSGENVKAKSVFSGKYEESEVYKAITDNKDTISSIGLDSNKDIGSLVNDLYKAESLAKKEKSQEKLDKINSLKTELHSAIMIDAGKTSQDFKESEDLVNTLVGMYQQNDTKGIATVLGLDSNATSEEIAKGLNDFILTATNKMKETASKTEAYQKIQETPLVKYLEGSSASPQSKVQNAEEVELFQKTKPIPMAQYQADIAGLFEKVKNNSISKEEAITSLAKSLSGFTKKYYDSNKPLETQNVEELKQAFNQSKELFSSLGLDDLYDDFNTLLTKHDLTKSVNKDIFIGGTDKKGNFQKGLLTYLLSAMQNKRNLGQLSDSMKAQLNQFKLSQMGKNLGILQAIQELVENNETQPVNLINPSLLSEDKRVMRRTKDGSVQPVEFKSIADASKYLKEVNSNLQEFNRISNKLLGLSSKTNEPNTETTETSSNTISEPNVVKSEEVKPKTKKTKSKASKKPKDTSSDKQLELDLEPNEENSSNEENSTNEEVDVNAEVTDETKPEVRENQVEASVTEDNAKSEEKPTEEAYESTSDSFLDLVTDASEDIETIEEDLGNFEEEQTSQNKPIEQETTESNTKPKDVSMNQVIVNNLVKAFPRIAKQWGSRITNDTVKFDTKDNGTTFNVNGKDITLPRSLLVELRRKGLSLSKNLLKAATKRKENFTQAKVGSFLNGIEDTQLKVSLTELMTVFDKQISQTPSVLLKSSKNNPLFDANGFLNLYQQVKTDNGSNQFVLPTYTKAGLFKALLATIMQAPMFSYNKETVYTDYWNSIGAMYQIYNTTEQYLYGKSAEPVFINDIDITTLGQTRSKIISMLGSNAIEQLGLEWDYKSEEYSDVVRDGLEQSIGLVLLNILMQQGIVQEHTVFVKDIKGNIVKSIPYINFVTNLNDPTTVRLEKTNKIESDTVQRLTKLKDKEIQGLFFDSVAKLRGVITKSKDDVIGETNGLDTRNVNTKNKFTSSQSASLKEGVAVHNNIKFVVNNRLFNMVKLHPEGLKALFGYNHKVDKLPVSDATKKAIKSRNNAIERSLNYLTLFVDNAIANGLTQEEIVFEFNHRVVPNMRIMMDSTISPQSDKIIRELLNLFQFETNDNGETIEAELKIQHTLPKSTKPRTIKDLVEGATTGKNLDREFSISFMLALAQALDVAKLEKLKDTKIFQNLVTALTKGENAQLFQKVIDGLWEMQLASERKEATVDLTKETEEAFIEFGQLFGTGSARAVNALSTLANFMYLGTEKDSNRHFKNRLELDTSLNIESDGISNGGYNVIRQFTSGFTENYLNTLKRTGTVTLDVLSQMFAKHVGITTGTDLALEDKIFGSATMFGKEDVNKEDLLDIYEVIAQQLSERANLALRNVIDWAKDVNEDYSKLSMKDLTILEENDDFPVEVYRDLRFLIQMEMTGHLKTSDLPITQIIFKPHQNIALSANFLVEVKRNLAKAGVTPKLYGSGVKGVASQLTSDIRQQIRSKTDDLIAYAEKLDQAKTNEEKQELKQKINNTLTLIKQYGNVLGVDLSGLVNKNLLKKLETNSETREEPANPEFLKALLNFLGKLGLNTNDIYDTEVLYQGNYDYTDGSVYYRRYGTTQNIASTVIHELGHRSSDKLRTLIGYNNYIKATANIAKNPFIEKCLGSSISRSYSGKYHTFNVYAQGLAEAMVTEEVLMDIVGARYTNNWKEFAERYQITEDEIPAEYKAKSIPNILSSWIKAIKDFVMVLINNAKPVTDQQIADYLDSLFTYDDVKFDLKSKFQTDEPKRIKRIQDEIERFNKQNKKKKFLLFNLNELKLSPSFEKVAKQLGGVEAYKQAVEANKTHLPYEAWVHVRTPEFKEWFGDWENNPKQSSQIINAQTKEPLLASHQDFETELSNDFREGGNSGKGIYFAMGGAFHQNKLRAVNKKGGYGQERFVGFLNVRKPLITDGTIKNQFTDPSTGETLSLNNAGEEYIEKLKSYGYDGVVSRWGKGFEVVIWDKAQADVLSQYTIKTNEDRTSTRILKQARTAKEHYTEIANAINNAIANNSVEVQKFLRDGLADYLNEAVENTFKVEFGNMQYSIIQDTFDFTNFIVEFKDNIQVAIAQRNQRKGYDANDPRNADPLTRSEYVHILKNIASTPAMATAFATQAEMLEDVIMLGNSVVKESFGSKETNTTLNNVFQNATPSNDFNVISNQLMSKYREFEAAGASNTTSLVPSTESKTQSLLLKALRKLGLSSLDVFDGTEIPFMFRNIVGKLVNKATNEVHLSSNIFKTFYDRFKRSGIIEVINSPFESKLPDVTKKVIYKADGDLFDLFNADVYNANIDTIKYLMAIATLGLKHYTVEIENIKNALQTGSDTNAGLIDKYTTNIKELNRYLRNLADARDELLTSTKDTVTIKFDIYNKKGNKINRDNPFFDIGYTGSIVQQSQLLLNKVTLDFAKKIANNHAVRAVEAKFLPAIINQFGGGNRGYFFNKERMSDTAKRFVNFVEQKYGSQYLVENDLRLDSKVLTEFLNTDAIIQKEYNKVFKDTLLRLNPDVAKIGVFSDKLDKITFPYENTKEFKANPVSKVEAFNLSIKNAKSIEELTDILGLVISVGSVKGKAQLVMLNTIRNLTENFQKIAPDSMKLVVGRDNFIKYLKEDLGLDPNSNEYQNQLTEYDSSNRSAGWFNSSNGGVIVIKDNAMNWTSAINTEVIDTLVHELNHAINHASFGEYYSVEFQEELEKTKPNLPKDKMVLVHSMKNLEGIALTFAKKFSTNKRMYQLLTQMEKLNGDNYHYTVLAGKQYESLPLYLKASANILYYFDKVKLEDATTYPEGWNKADVLEARKNSLDEFMAYAVSNETFIEKMNVFKNTVTNPQDKSLTQSFIDMLVKLKQAFYQFLGLNQKDYPDSLATAVMQEYFNIGMMDEFKFENNIQYVGRDTRNIGSVKYNENAYKFHPLFKPNSASSITNKPMASFKPYDLEDHNKYLANLGNLFIERSKDLLETNDLTLEYQEGEDVLDVMVNNNTSSYLTDLRTAGLSITNTEEEVAKLVSTGFKITETLNPSLYSEALNVAEEVVSLLSALELNRNVENALLKLNSNELLGLLATNKVLQDKLSNLDDKSLTKTQKLINLLENKLVFGKDILGDNLKTTLNELTKQILTFDTSKKLSESERIAIENKELQKEEQLLKAKDTFDEVIDKTGEPLHSVLEITKDAFSGRGLAQDGSDFNSTIGSLLRDIINNHEYLKGRPTLISKIMSWFLGLDYAGGYVADMIGKRAFQTEAVRTRMVDATAASIRKQFNQGLSNEQEQAINAVLLKTKLNNLTTSVNRLEKVMRSSKEREKYITEVEDRLAHSLVNLGLTSKQVDEALNVYLWQLQGLAELDQTGYAKGNQDSNLILPNINSIVGSNLTKDLLDKFEPNSELLDTMKELYTLYSLDYVDQNELVEFANLIQEQPDGVKSLLEAVNILDREIRLNDVAFFGKENFEMYQTNRNKDIVIVSSKDVPKIQEYQRLGYSEKMTLDNGKFIVLHTNVSITNKFTTGVLGLAEETINGQNLLTGKSINEVSNTRLMPDVEKQFKSAIVRAKNNRNYYSTLNNSSIAGLTVNEVGNVQNEVKIALPINVRKDLVEVYDEGIDAIANYHGRMMEEYATQQENTKIIDELNQIYQQSNQKHLFIKLDGNYKPKSNSKADIEFANRVNGIYRSLPSMVKTYINQLPNGFYINLNHANNLLGYHQASITDVFTGKSGLPEPVQAGIRAVFSLFAGISGFNPVKSAKLAEQAIQEIATTSKDFILNRSGVVAAGNLMSNYIHLWNTGVPLNKIAPFMAEGLKEVKEYSKDLNKSFEIDYLRKSRKISEIERARLNKQFELLSNKLAKSPVAYLVQKGILTSVESIELKTNDNPDYSLIKQLQNKTGFSKFKETSAGKVWGNIMVQEGSKTHNFMNQALDYGDFVAKYALFKHLTEARQFSKERALRVIQDEFINYQLNRGREFDWLNATGLTWFLSYKLGIQKIILRNLRRNFLRSLAVYEGVGSVTSQVVPMQNLIWDSSLSYQLSPSNLYKGFESHWLIQATKLFD